MNTGRGGIAAPFSFFQFKFLPPYSPDFNPKEVPY